MTVQEALRIHQLRHRAILATNFYNLETLQAILKAASTLQSPVILQLTESSIAYMGIDEAVAMARAGLKHYGLTGWIHLDHGRTVDLVARCLEKGFDSVMIDASEKPLEENIAITKTVVEMSHPLGVNVEAELGYVPKLGQADTHSGFTTPEEAARFVEETGVDALAVAIGSAHGFYKEPPHLDIPRLADIHAATPVVLVLHGSSGIPREQVQEAIRNGVAKVNLATEIKNCFMQNLKYQLTQTDEIDLRKVFPPVTEKVTDLLIDHYTWM